MRTMIKKEKGQSMVETALVLPILLALIIGIIDFGWLFYNKLTVGNCAREGARYAATYYNDDAMKAISDPEARKNAFKSKVEDRVNNSNTTNATFVTTVTGPDADRYITITVSADVPLLTPMFGAFFPDNKCEMESSVTMYVEDY